MGLTFAGGTDNVAVAAAASINNLTTATCCMWVYPTTLTALNRFMQKGTNPNQKLFGLANNALGAIEIDFGRGTGGAGNIGVYVSTTTPLATLNKWYFVAGVWDLPGGAGNFMHMYVGDLSTAPSEVPTTKQDGVGTSPVDSGANLIIGNQSVTGWQGSIGPFMFWNRALTLGEIQQQWFRRRKTSGCVVYTELGYNGTSTQPDWSGNGNAGTVTGPTQSSHPPIPAPFGYSVQLPYVLGSTPVSTVNDDGWIFVGTIGSRVDTVDVHSGGMF